MFIIDLDVWGAYLYGPDEPAVTVAEYGDTPADGETLWDR